jgi:hypothetical protein
MTTTGLAVFVFVGFLLPVPILNWLDRVRAESTVDPDEGPA